jgi:hypothetical protein
MRLAEWAVACMAFWVATAVSAYEMVGSSLQPTRDECTAIRKHNDAIVKSIVQAHQACLDGPSQENIFNRPSSPCSKFQCRDLHLKMDEAYKVANDLASECSRRASRREPIVVGAVAPQMPDPTPPPGDGGRRDSWETVKKIDTAIFGAIDLSRVRKDPKYLVEMAWGEASSRFRAHIAREIQGERSASTVESEVVRYLFDRSTGALGEASRNPVARVVNEAMLNRLFTIYTQAHSELEGAFESLDRELKTQPRDRRRPGGAPGALTVRERAVSGSSAGANACAAITDPSRSDALRRSDPGGWLYLAMSCNR